MYFSRARSITQNVIRFATFVFAFATAPFVAADNLPPVVEFYTNPLTLTDVRTGPVVSCPDPAIISETKGSLNAWYMYCTGDPLNSHDTDQNGNLIGHLITSFRSVDLIHWTYIGDVLSQRPAWVDPTTNLWAPAVKYFNNRYYLYYVAPATAPPLTGSAIGVATSDSPAGPWVDSGAPVVAPEPAFCCPGSRRAVIDPDVIEDDTGQRYITFGSYFGGISGRKLSADGLTSDPSSEVQLTIDNRYEGASFVKHNGFYYLFASATNCCNGPLTGYIVFAGRSTNPMGPYEDKQGVSLLDPSTGGTPVLDANGNRWVGPGGNVVFTDASGRQYALYHAVDQYAPYFDLHPGFTRRPALIDPLDWVDDWPVVRGGYGPSDNLQPSPAAQPYQLNLYVPSIKPDDEPGLLLKQYSDEFNSSTLAPQWHFIHPAANNTYTLTGSAYEVQTQGPDLNGDPTHVEILAESVPPGDYLVETKLSTTIPPGPACCYNFAQGALLIYGNDQNNIKADVFANFDTRQTEFGKEVGPVPANYPTYGNSVIGPPDGETWLRLAIHHRNGYELYTSYSSNDGLHWDRGSTWIHQLGSGALIGIAAQNFAGITVDFDYVRVYSLR